MNNNTVQILIEAVNRTGVAFAEVKSAMGGLGESAGVSGRAVAGLGSEMAKTEAAAKHSGERMGELGATLRSTVLYAAAVGAAWQGLRAIMSLPMKGFDFLAEMESAKLSIAGILTATQGINTLDGARLEGTDKLNAAQGISEKLMKEIQLAALVTTATVPQIVTGFQALLGPATAAGATVEETKDLTLLMVQAMGALKIEMNQISAEGRSLLDGSINPMQDRLAVALGITAEMVGEWKKGGTLLQELKARLEPFKLMSADVAKTWAGLSSNIMDAVAFVASEFTGGIFESVKAGYQGFLNLLVDTEKYAVGSGIKELVELLGEIGKVAGGLVVSGFQAAENALRTLNDFAKENRASIMGIVEGFASMVTAGGGLVGVVSRIVGGLVQMGTSLGFVESMFKIIAAGLNLLVIGASAVSVIFGKWPVMVGRLANFFSSGSGNALVAYGQKMADIAKEAIKAAAAATGLTKAMAAQKAAIDGVLQPATRKEGITRALGEAEKNLTELMKAKLKAENEELSSLEASIDKHEQKIATLQKEAGAIQQTTDDLLLQIEQRSMNARDLEDSKSEQSAKNLAIAKEKLIQQDYEGAKAAAEKAQTEGAGLKNTYDAMRRVTEAGALLLEINEKNKVVEGDALSREKTDYQKLKQNIDELSVALKGLPQKTVMQISADITQAQSDIQALKASLASISDIKISVAVAQKTNTQGGIVEGFSKGGIVPGYGGGDRRPALLEDGEAIIPKHIVRELGVGFFRQLISMRGGLPSALGNYARNMTLSLPAIPAPSFAFAGGMQTAAPGGGDVHRFEINIGGVEFGGLTSSAMLKEMEKLTRRRRLTQA